MTGFPINPPNSPLGNDSSGRPVIVSHEWYRFFAQIQKMIGGPVSPFDDAELMAYRGDTAAWQGMDDIALLPAVNVVDDSDMQPPMGSLLAFVPDMIATRAWRVATVSGPITLADDLVLVDASAGPVTMTLPTAASALGRAFNVKKIDAIAYPVTLAGSGSDTIDGGATVVIVNQYESITVLATSYGWSIL